MATINIGASNADDAFYRWADRRAASARVPCFSPAVLNPIPSLLCRYKMPKLVAKVRLASFHGCGCMVGGAWWWLSGRPTLCAPAPSSCLCCTSPCRLRAVATALRQTW